MATADMHATDCPCSKSELELYQGRNVQTVMEKASWVDVFPLNNLSNVGPIEFVISGSTDEYIDLNDTMLVIKCKVVNQDGTNLVANARVAPVNNWFHSMWSDVSLQIGEKQIEGGTFMYPYKSYLKNLTTYNKLVKETTLVGSGWYKDQAGQMETHNNTGFAARQALIALSQTVEMSGTPKFDLFDQSKYMINNVDIRLKFTPAKPEFQFISLAADAVPAPNVKTVITDAILYVRRVKITPSTILENESRITSQNAIYPIQKTDVVTYTIAQGSRSHNKEAVFRGLMPKLVIVGLVHNNAFNGSFATNPFNFEHANLNQIALYREGESVPMRPLTPNFATGVCMREYQTFMQQLGYYNSNDSIDISYDEFKNGYTLYAFNLTPDLTISGNSQPYRDGNLRIEMSFSVATTESINVVVFAVFDGQVEVTKYRSVVTDFHT